MFSFIDTGITIFLEQNERLAAFARSTEQPDNNEADESRPAGNVGEDSRRGNGGNGGNGNGGNSSNSSNSAHGSGVNSNSNNSNSNATGNSAGGGGGSGTGGSDVGILDLSMPDKNAMTEVCYVCGDEYRRGSLSELSTREPKDESDTEPTFPIFNEAHPRPARSRPKDPRCMVQACKACVQHLMQQWQQHQTANASVFNRPYTLRKRPAPVSADRATFVCYTCGVETVSSMLRLVYCNPNAELEPYYPFIKTLTAYANASPISPQGK